MADRKQVKHRQPKRVSDENTDITDLCDCELPGYFHSGVPGIIAGVQDGKLVTAVSVERCDLCQRYASDEAARQKLIELGMA